VKKKSVSDHFDGVDKHYLFWNLKKILNQPKLVRWHNQLGCLSNLNLN